MRAKPWYEGPGGCWLWTGYLDSEGYGRIKHNLLAHRWAYETFVGPIPDGLSIDHLCRNTSCMNPMHLEPVTIQENIKRGADRRRLCRKGHLLDDAYTTNLGYRRCKACVRIRDAKTKQKR